MDNTSPQKRVGRIVVLMVASTAFLAVCLLLAGYLYLPALVTQRLPVAQIKRLGFSDFTGRVSSIGLNRTEAGPFFFGHADQPALAIGSLTLDYTPGDLRRKKINRIGIRDVVVNASFGPGGISLPGLDPSALAKDANLPDNPPDKASPLTAVMPEKFEIRSGMLNLKWRQATYRIPFEADLEPDGRDLTTLEAHVRLFPRDQPMMVTAWIDVENRKGRLSLDGPAVDLDRFADLVHLVAGLNATGKVNLKATAMMQLDPFALAEAEVDLAWHSGELTYGTLRIQPGPAGEPAHLTAGSGGLKAWQVMAGGIQLGTSVPVTLNTLVATVNLDGGLRTVAGNTELSVRPGEIDYPVPVTINAGVSLPLAFEAAQEVSGEWSAMFRTTENGRDTPSEPLDGAIAGMAIHSAPPRFSLSAKGAGQQGGADWQMDWNTVRAVTAGTVVTLPSAHGRGQLQFKEGPHGAIWSGDARMGMRGPTIDGHGLSGKLDRMTVSARFQQQGSAPQVVDARVQFEGGRFRHSASGLSLSGSRLDLPYHSGAGTASRRGTFSVDRVVHQKHLYGNIQGQVTQKKDTYTFTATHAVNLFPGMNAIFSGTARTKGYRVPLVDVTFNIPSYELPVESELGNYFPAAKGMSLTGTLSARGAASFSQQGVNAFLELQMAGGALRMAEKKMVVEGIDATLRFPELPHIRSAPAQQVQFDRAAMGGIVVDGGTVDFQVESQKTLFVEKGRLSWCGGKVDAGSLRITADKQDYQLSLYCQRLALSRILEQLGSVNAKGTGTVNGKIPIIYRNGEIRFDDGFLFSTPGEGGRIHLTGTEILTRGIPAGTPQFIQVDLAREALKDYAYTWAKLGLASEGEDLVMRLQFDGKPVNPLPFIYKKELGSFVRVEAGAQGSVFQGIGLDVNLRLPLNQLLQYKDIIDMVE